MELNLCMGCMREKTQPGPCPYCGFDEHAYVPSPHHLPPQTILAGKYLVGRVLGEGGFGITYLGWDLNLEMKIAVKECFPNGFVTRDCRYTNTITMMTGGRAEFYQKSLNKFVDEARRLGKFWRLPGIVAVRDFFQENKTAYIVMEFAEGVTLKEFLKGQPGGRLPAEEVFEMLRPVMDSLMQVHKAGMIHRDISPDNLMIDEAGGVKLLDFGAARDFMTDGERSLSVMLKPGYAPSEQYRSKGHQGPWTDIYALCATMYRAITGQVPPESLDRMEGEHLKRPTELNIEIEPHKEEALLKGMACAAKDRYQSVDELIEALYQKAPDVKREKENIYQERESVYKEVCDDTKNSAETVQNFSEIHKEENIEEAIEKNIEKNEVKAPFYEAEERIFKDEERVLKGKETAAKSNATPVFYNLEKIFHDEDKKKEDKKETDNGLVYLYQKKSDNGLNYLYQKKNPSYFDLEDKLFQDTEIDKLEQKEIEKEAAKKTKLMPNIKKLWKNNL